MEDYLTLKQQSSDEFYEKRSRFIGYARPVSTQQEAVDFINEIRSIHWNATHNVYAYILRDGQTRRFSDDGEPSGTAGMPVLDVLVKENLTDCVVVATRYFGGVLLGAGGLVRAYSHTSKIAVEAAKIVKMSLCSVLCAECDYNFYSRLNSLVFDFGGTVERTDFGQRVRLEFFISKFSEPEFCAKLLDLSLGKVKIKKISEKYAQIE